jgi:hypothetical protein
MKRDSFGDSEYSQKPSWCKDDETIHLLERGPSIFAESS